MLLLTRDEMERLLLSEKKIRKDTEIELEKSNCLLEVEKSNFIKYKEYVFIHKRDNQELIYY